MRGKVCISHRSGSVIVEVADSHRLRGGGWEKTNPDAQ